MPNIRLFSVNQRLAQVAGGFWAHQNGRKGGAEGWGGGENKRVGCSFSLGFGKEALKSSFNWSWFLFLCKQFVDLQHPFFACVSARRDAIFQSWLCTRFSFSISRFTGRCSFSLTWVC